MPDFRRWRISGASYFLTIVTADRRPLFWDDFARVTLRNKISESQKEWAFDIDAIVLLPDHWHAIFTLPPGDHRLSTRLGWIKKEFTKTWLAAGGSESDISRSKALQRRRGIWQMRFWEHAIRDDHDFEAHMDYIHYNPVKHGYALAPSAWEWSSFRNWVGKGVYPLDWGTGVYKPPKITSTVEFGE